MLGAKNENKQIQTSERDMASSPWIHDCVCVPAHVRVEVKPNPAKKRARATNT
jgi:hypothetical protein